MTMESFFLNPLNMLAGAALVSVPIIIHLINRMRFRRVKWAAMEFLLKAQKRMRRKLIIEQLILLLLRCLMVFLFGFLLARFLGLTPLENEEARPTAHVVILDDSPSTADTATVEGRQATAFEQAKLQVTDRIAPAAAQANTPQSMDILLLSELATPRPFERLNETTIDDMKSYLRPLQPSSVRVSLVNGLRRAKEVLDKQPDTDVAKVIHIVSDLRGVDWVEDGETLKQLIGELTTSGIRIHLIDVAYPDRKDTERQPRSNDNIGIVEFRPKARVVARGQALEFELRVKNYGNTELKDVRVEFFLNGRRWNEVSTRIPSLPPNQERTQTVLAAAGLQRVASKDNPLDAYNLVTARLADQEAGGLAADNIRHAVVEVRPLVPVLVIEGRQNMRDNPKGDGFFLKRLFQDAFGGINWVDGREEDLEKHDLRQYAAIYLLNVPTLNEAQRDKLEGYIRDGGGVGIFLGPNVRPGEYTKNLYRSGEGFFPFPLPGEPTSPPTEEERIKRSLVLSKRILTRDAASKSHPALAGLYTNESGGLAKDVEIERYFMFVNVNQYWPVLRFGKWREDRSIQELFCLPNEQPVAEYEGQARDLLARMKAKAGEPKFEKYRQYLEPLDRQIRETAAGQAPLTMLARRLDQLLCDQINDGDPSEPILREFWSQPEMIDLKAEFQRLRDTVKFGDPLYLVKQFGKGRVAVMTTDAGGTHTNPTGSGDVQWTDWPTGSGYPGWVAVVSEMQKYLAGGAIEENRAVGSTVSAAFEAARYKNSVARTFVTADPAKAEKGGDIPLTNKSLGDQPLPASGGNLNFSFNEAKEPGAYFFTFTNLGGANGATEKPEFMPYVFNIDTRREGDLRRVNRDDLAQQAPNVPVHSPDDTTWVSALKQRRDDFSTRHWIYLLIMLVLIAEQAMAVRLSFHTRPEDVETHAPSAAAAYAHGAPPAIVADAAEPEPEAAPV
jgi:hypothetical protein